MFTFCITVATLCGIFIGMVIANERASRRLADDLREAEARAFKQGELAAWQEANRRLSAA